MATADRTLGLIGLGDMGRNIAKRLHDNGYRLVLYDRTKDKYGFFNGMDEVHLSADINDFVKKLRDAGKDGIIWIMVPGGPVTNDMVAELSELLSRNDMVIDGSNSVYLDSIGNYKKLKHNGIFYLDVGCAGGPADLLKGVALMVGGDRAAFERAEDVFRIVSGNGTYGYVGESGSGHMAKMIHNGIFYGIFPVYAEGVELLLSMKDKEHRNFDTKEALRLLKSSPPITVDIMEAMSNAINAGQLPNDAPEIKVSDIIKWEGKKAEELGVSFDITNAVLAGYASMSEKSRKIYGAAKKIITGH